MGASCGFLANHQVGGGGGGVSGQPHRKIRAKLGGASIPDQ